VNAEIIAIGTELLLGEIVDTNSAHIAKKLRTIGLNLFYTSSVGDNEQRITDVIKHGLERSEVVLTTGGLGPTVDDMTREAIARATDRQLFLDEKLLVEIEERFSVMGRKMTDNNKRQAYRPTDSIAISNPVGTAPSFIVDTGKSVVISLPGVPREMDYLMDCAVIPYLRERFNLKSIIKSRVLRVSGLGESVVDQHIGDLEKLSNPTVGLNAHAGFVDVRITAKAEKVEDADTMIAEVEKVARERLGDHIFGVDGDTLESVVISLLAKRSETVAVIGSGTSGRMTGRLSTADPDHKFFRGGKNVPIVESDENMEMLAKSVAEEFNTVYGLACVVTHTDIRVAMWRQGKALNWRRTYTGHPDLAPEWAVNAALNELRRAL
ncbi:MAG: CinA family nicotinamide mononucleotide deamidase-related protein, partial [Chloroflexota bacterium]